MNNAGKDIFGEYMKIICDKCRSVFIVDERRIAAHGSKGRCSRCGHMIRIYPPGSSADEKPVPQNRTAAKAAKKDTRQKKKPKSASNLQNPPVFQVMWEKKCPLYQKGDEFQLAGNIFSVPRNTAPCMILAKDIVNLLKKKMMQSDARSPSEMFQCSGCAGMIRFVRKEHFGPEETADLPNEDYVEVVTQGLSGFPIFQALDDHVSHEFASSLRFDEFGVGELIVKKGDPGRNLYIVITGRVEVLGDDEMRIAEMGRGDVFGEMSLLSGNTVGATIKALEPTTVLYITARDLKTILSNSPSLQMYFTRLLAGRMAEINQARYEEFSSGISGKISEMIPTELFQIFHMNQKTGILKLQSVESRASISFRDGELVRVLYNDKRGKDAFFELLKLKRGRFTFRPGLNLEEMEAPALGDFMPLLMEGLRRIDEDGKHFLRAVFPKII